MKKTTSLLCVACALAEAVAFASPEDYRLHYDTPEQAQAHIARLWHPAEKDITRLWPEGKVQLRKADAPQNLLVRELYDSNVVATDVNDPFFVFAGTNDFNANVPLGEWYVYSEAQADRNGRLVTLKKRAHSADARTFRGRLNAALGHLREKFPLTRLVLLTPIHRGYAKFGPANVQIDESFANELGLFIDDYVNVVKEAGNVWAAKVLDLNAAGVLYPNAPGQDAFIHRADTDRLHPSTEGHARLAEAIAQEVGELML